MSKIAISAAILAGGGFALGYSAYRRSVRKTDEAVSRLVALSEPPSRLFDMGLAADLPEVGQRYFRHAIALGTPLFAGVELEMEGTLLLGDKADPRACAMSAREVLRSTAEFVWVPQLRSGGVTITGSDGLVRGEAWTRFWLAGLLPVARVRTSPDLVRSARFRGAVEGALWLPPSLLPENGVRWEQIGPNEARVTFERFAPEITLHLTLGEDGSVKEAFGQRWSDANLERSFQLQAFGGTMSGEGTFQGLTIPTQVAVGNHYGASDYLPFFQAHITNARFF